MVSNFKDRLPDLTYIVQVEMKRERRRKLSSPLDDARPPHSIHLELQCGSLIHHRVQDPSRNAILMVFFLI